MDYTLSGLVTLPRLEVTIAPQAYDPAALTLARCEEVVSTSQVRARGWYFPHINRDRLAAGPRSAYLANETEAAGWVNHLERWRLYTTGQFVFQAMLWDVPDAELQAKMLENARYEIKANANIAGFVNFVGLIYSIGEVFVFASRLAQAVPFQTQVDVLVGLRSVKHWALGSSDFGADITPYTTPHDSPEQKVSVPLDVLIASPLAIATKATVGIFEQFGWLNPSPNMIAQWQAEIFKKQR